MGGCLDREADMEYELSKKRQNSLSVESRNPLVRSQMERTAFYCSVR